MSRYEVAGSTREGEAIEALRDSATGAEALVWPGFGSNCFSLALPSPVDGATRVTVIQDPPSLDEIRQRPSWWGVPLLFPFPGAMPDGVFSFQGQRYRLGRPDQPVVPEGKEVPGTRRNFHGFVMDLPWRVSGRSADDQGAVVRSTLDSRDHPEAHEGFPFPYRVEAAYRLDERGLRLDFGVQNPGEGTLPFGFGAHPYFKLPLGEEGSPAECLVRIPASERWNPHERASVPVPEALDLRSPRPFVEQTYNGIYRGLARLPDDEGGPGAIEAFVRDPHAGIETVMRASGQFQNVVFWSPPGRTELCLEPWTCPSNVFNLAAEDVPGHGMLTLAPGDTWSATMWISLRVAGR